MSAARSARRREKTQDCYIHTLSDLAQTPERKGANSRLAPPLRLRRSRRSHASPNPAVKRVLVTPTSFSLSPARKFEKRVVSCETETEKRPRFSASSPDKMEWVFNPVDPKSSNPLQFKGAPNPFEKTCTANLPGVNVYRKIHPGVAASPPKDGIPMRSGWAADGVVGHKSRSNARHGPYATVT